MRKNKVSVGGLLWAGCGRAVGGSGWGGFSFFWSIRVFTVWCTSLLLVLFLSFYSTLIVLWYSLFCFCTRDFCWFCCGGGCCFLVCRRCDDWGGCLIVGFPSQPCRPRVLAFRCFTSPPSYRPYFLRPPKRVWYYFRLWGRLRQHILSQPCAIISRSLPRFLSFFFFLLPRLFFFFGKLISAGKRH